MVNKLDVKISPKVKINMVVVAEMQEKRRLGEGVRPGREKETFEKIDNRIGDLTEAKVQVLW